jgi:hypothetical protein
MPYSPAKPLPRSATLCVGRDCAHFRHIFFLFLFFLFFRPRGGGRVGHVEGQDPQGYVVLRALFCYLERLPAIRIRRMAIASFPKFIAYSRHQSGVGAGSDRTIFPGAAGRYSSELIPWIRGLFLRLSPKVANGPYGRTL